MDDRDLSHLLDGEPGPEPTPDALAEVMRRHRRAGLRALTGALVIVLVAGPVGGYLLARSTESGGNATVAAGSAGGSAGASAGQSAADAIAGALGSLGSLPDLADTALADLGLKGVGGKLTHAFDRTADGAAIRAYQRDITLPTRPDHPDVTIPAECKPSGALVAELSTSEAVGQGMALVFAGSTGALQGVRIGLFGVAEGAPVAFAIAKVDGSVKRVRFRLASGATDEMAPEGGWAVLAHHLTVAAGTEPKLAIEGAVVEALDADGKVLASQTTAGSIPQVPDACRSALRGHFRPDGPPRLAPRKPPTTSTTIATQ